MGTLLKGKTKDLDGFSVTRILPHAEKRMVGPFVFLDHMGPADFAAGEGIDVRPHPHIGLATLTYLTEGSILHRDSLGNNLEILPGDVNWMTAGRGIVHSERETHETKANQHQLNGLQCWIALPEQFAEIEPAFAHHKKCQLPQFNKEGVFARLIAGDALGMTSPIRTYSPMFFLDVILSAGSHFVRPNQDQECALYVLEGNVDVNSELYEKGDFVLLDADDVVASRSFSRVVFLGGEQWPKTPHMYWNFVSFSKERIEQAKRDWQEGRFPDIPGDNQEFTPLP
ncbi:pirin family protein [Thalassolituus maritimus]|uniref:Pirin family protein n=1 Tax=Thalassolituus maritimus TaxID=484498 RepID=A0ABP9ZWT4_9GAMM